MMFGTQAMLVKTITTKSGGCIASYKLRPKGEVPVLFLPHLLTDDQLRRVRTIIIMEPKA